MDAFCAEYQKLTIERINDSNQHDILMSVLGAPRSYEGVDELMRAFMVPMLTRMQEICANPPQKPGVKPVVKKEKTDEKDKKDDKEAAPNKMELLGDAIYFGFKDIYVPRDRSNPDSAVPKEKIPDVVKNWEVIGDLISRIASEGLSSLNSFFIRNLSGEKIGRYVVYHYTFSVTGEIAKVRALVQNLNGAARENRMYIVRSIFLYADRDGAQEIFLERQQEVLQKRQELESGKETPQQEAAPTEPVPRHSRRRRNADDMPPDMGPGMEQPVEKVKTPAQIRAEELKKPYNKRIGYGRMLFGGSPNCEAVFDVEYVYLAEPELD